MSDLFLRYGDPFTGAVARDAKGKPYFMQARVCSRCGGAGGSDKWAHTGWTCFECGGSGKHRNGPERVNLYTREELDRLNAAKAKRDAKRVEAATAKAEAAKAEADARRADFEALHGALLTAAEPFGARSEFVRDVVRKARERCTLTEGQEIALRNTITKMAAEDAARAASGFVGEIGQRIEVAVTVDRVASFPRPVFGGGGMETVWIVTMRDEAGNAIVSKTPRFRAEKGETFKLRATVKEHSTYRDEKQTLVQRCEAR